MDFSFIQESEIGVDETWPIMKLVLERTPPSWEECFQEANEDLEHISNLIEREKRKGNISPMMKDIFKAFWYTRLDNVKIVLVGQDPYPEDVKLFDRIIPRSTGLCFSVRPEDKIPSSLINVFKELKRTIPDFPDQVDGDLRGWAVQGVLMLNMSLTIFNNKPGSHDGIWDGFLVYVVKHIHKINPNCLYITWGNLANRLRKIVGEKNPFIEGAHPSNRNKNGGFLNNDYFNEANRILAKQGLKIIDWSCKSLLDAESKPIDFFQYKDEMIRIQLEEEEKKKKEAKNHLPEIVKKKLLRAFQEGKLDEIKKSKINLTQIKNWAKEYQIKVPNSNKEGVIKHIYEIISTRNQMIKSELDTYYPMQLFYEGGDFFNDLNELGFTIQKGSNYDFELIERFHQFMKSCHETYDKDDASTWPKSEYIQHYIAQTELLWKAREYALPFFQKIWKRDILLTSFEGASFFYQLEKGETGVKGDQNLMIDQKSNHFSSVRAMISLTNTSHFIFLEASKEKINEYQTILNQNPKYKPKLGDPIFKNSKLWRVITQPGDILFWDARMFYFHKIETGPINVGCYVSMMPPDAILPIEVKKRLKAYENGLSTNHWCYGDEFKVFPLLKYKSVLPDNQGKPEKIEIAQLTPLRRMMIS